LVAPHTVVKGFGFCGVILELSMCTVSLSSYVM
jgi:hypothetical protein